MRLTNITPYRFIPAHAGNTLRPQRRVSLPTVHPRTRGEHVLKVVADVVGRRFIPAHAGNTLLVWRIPASIAVHPRTRGEHSSSYANCRLVNGSSPHTRGTLLSLALYALLRRFIPAHAGNTSR